MICPHCGATLSSAARFCTQCGQTLAVAAANSADFLCFSTPAEDLRLPSVQDVREGVIASKIAAHAADLANGVPGARDWDDRMARARQRLDWPAMFDEASTAKRPKNTWRAPTRTTRAPAPCAAPCAQCAP